MTTTTINTSLPASNAVLSSSVVRGNFVAAANDINALWLAVGGGGGPVDLANAVGNLAVSHLNSGVNAANTTVWHGDGTWQAQLTSSVGIVAAGTNLTTSTKLTSTASPVMFVITGGTPGTGIALPTANPSRGKVTLVNTLAFAIACYPSSTAQSINNLAVGVPFMLPPNSSTEFTSSTTNAWYCDAYTPANITTFYGDNTGVVDLTAAFTSLFSVDGHYVIPPGQYLSGAITPSNRNLTIEFQQGAKIISTAGVDILWQFTDCNLTLINPSFDGHNNCQIAVKAIGGTINVNKSSMVNIGPISGTATNIVCGYRLSGVRSIYMSAPTFSNINSSFTGTFGTGPGAARDIYMDGACGYAYIAGYVGSGDGNARELDLIQSQLGNAGGAIVGPTIRYNGNIRRCMKFESGKWDIVAPNIAPRFLMTGFVTPPTAPSPPVVSLFYDSAYTITFTQSATGSEAITLSSARGTETITFNGTYTAGDVITMTMASSAFANSPITASYTLQTGDGAYAAALYFGTVLPMLANVFAPDSYFKVAASAPAVMTIYYPTATPTTFAQSATGAEVITLAAGSALGSNSTETATFSGTYAAGDVLTLTLTNASLVGSPLTLSYTVTSSDTAQTVAQIFTAMINGFANLGAANTTAGFSTQVGTKNLNCVDWATTVNNPTGSVTVHGGNVDSSGYVVGICDSGDGAPVLALGTRIMHAYRYVNRTDPQSGATVTNGNATGFYAPIGDIGSGMLGCAMYGSTSPFILQGDKQFVRACQFFDPINQGFIGATAQTGDFILEGNYFYTKTTGALSQTSGAIRVQNVLNGVYNNNYLIEDGNISHNNKFIDFTNASATGVANNNWTLCPGLATTPVTPNSAAITVQLSNGVVTLPSQSDKTILANISGSSAAPSGSTLTAILDNILGTTRGALVTRTASGWTLLAPGGAGTKLTANGAGADLTWT